MQKLLSLEISENETFLQSIQDGNIYEHFKNKFDEVFIIFHPFLKLKENCIKKHISKWTKKDYLRNYIQLPWREILKQTSLKNYKELDIALKSSIGAVGNDYIREDFIKILEVLKTNLNITCEAEGIIPPHVENSFFHALKLLGYVDIFLLEEFAQNKDLHCIDDILLSNYEMIPVQGSAITKDNKILLASHWDSHYSFLCGNKKDIEKILNITNFEGFYAKEDTEVYWAFQD